MQQKQQSGLLISVQGLILDKNYEISYEEGSNKNNKLQAIRNRVYLGFFKHILSSKFADSGQYKQ
jgi:hypothetical protein